MVTARKVSSRHVILPSHSYCLSPQWYNVVDNLSGPFKREIQSTVTAAHSCDGEISVLNHCLSWSKFVNTHLVV